MPDRASPIQTGNLIVSPAMIPPGASAKNIRFVSRCDQGGRPDGVQVILHKGHAFIGHMFSDGYSVVDVRDPLHPEDGQFHCRAEEHPLASPANSRRYPARGQRAQYLGDAAICQPGRLLRQVAGRTRCKPSSRSAPASASSTSHSRRARARSVFSTPQGSAPIASGGSVAATPMCRCISRASSITCWRWST